MTSTMRPVKYSNKREAIKVVVIVALIANTVLLGRYINSADYAIFDTKLVQTETDDYRSTTTTTTTTNNNNATDSINHQLLLEIEQLRVQELQTRLETLTLQLKRHRQETQNHNESLQSKLVDLRLALKVAETTTTQLSLEQAEPRPYTTTTDSYKKKHNHITIPLNDLIHTGPEPKCRSKTFLYNSTLLSESITHGHSKIPRLIHFTSKSKCLAEVFTKNLQKWHFSNYSVLLHDDAAMYRMLYKDDWVDTFPHIQLLEACMISGAAKADLWRAMILWEYGGIYSDIDNAPGHHFFNGDAIQPTDDAYFVIDQQTGVLSQYFMSASPKHPLMYLNIQKILFRLLGVESVGTQYVPYVTGPGALKVATILFLKNSSGYFRTGGIHYGVANRSLTVAGGKRGKTQVPSQNIVIRESIHGQEKKSSYGTMGMVHFNGAKKKNLVDSCFLHLTKLESKKQAQLLVQQHQDQKQEQKEPLTVLPIIDHPSETVVENTTTVAISTTNVTEKK